MTPQLKKRRRGTPLKHQVQRRIHKSRAAQRADGQATRERVLEFMRQRALSGDPVPPSHREIMSQCNISSTSVVNYHLRILEKQGRIVRRPGQSRASFIPGGISPLYTVDAPSDDQTFLKTRDALLDYFQRSGEHGLHLHWTRRAIAPDELPFLAAAVTAHALKEKP